MLPCRKVVAGDTVYIRATVIEAGSDYFQVVVDDGMKFSITCWVPAGECALQPDIAELKPPRRANPRHIER